MISPLRQDQPLLDDIRNARPAPDGFALWWLGQSGFLFKHRANFVLIDPYLSDSLARKYAGTDKPHVRMTGRCVNPTELEFVDLVLSTHGHTDHFDAETLRAIGGARRRTKPLTLVLPAANLEGGREMMVGLDVRLVPIDAGQSVTVGAIGVRAVPAAHVALECDAAGRHRFLGYILQLGAWSVYHSGDTVWHEDVAAAAAAARPDVALLPINGHHPARGVAGNLDGPEAAKLAHLLRVKMTIPHHFDMFEFNTADPSEFATACDSLSVPFLVLSCGESWSPPRN